MLRLICTVSRQKIETTGEGTEMYRYQLDCTAGGSEGTVHAAKCMVGVSSFAA